MTTGLWGLYVSILVLRRKRPALWVWWLVSVYAIYLFRSYAAIVLGLTMLIYLAIGWRASRLRKGLIIGGILVFAAVVPFLLGKGLFASGQFIRLFSPDELLSFRRIAYSSGGSSASITLDFHSPISFVLTYGYSLLTVMIGPFPWQVHAMVQAVALPEAVFVWFLFPLWVRGLWDVIKRRGGEERFLVIFATALCGAIALFSDNIGANTRLRLLPWCAFFVYAALRLAQERAVSRSALFLAHRPGSAPQLEP